MFRARLLGLIGAVLFTCYPIFEVASGAGNNERGDTTLAPPKSPRAPAGEPRREATCRTTLSAGQASMSHEDCAFIASQIPVLSSKTERQVHSGATLPSPTFQPGADIPSDVRDLKPLPATVTQRLPALRGYQYFLAGQDIVVVGRGAKIAFVIDVRVRP